MNVSNLVNAPVRLATNCWQTVCQNKKTIAAVTASVAVVAIAVILCNQTQNLYHLQDRLLNIVATAKKVAAHGKIETIDGSIKRASKCPHFYTPYKTAIDTTTPSNIDSEVEELYNAATSYGRDLFSSYSLYVTQGPLPPRSTDPLKATILICRSGFDNWFSAPWQQE